MKLGRNEKCHCGNNQKYKRCCLEKDEKKEALRERVKKLKTMTRQELFISSPYKKCPNPECLADDAFGVFMPTEQSREYSRECIKCGHTQGFPFPKIKKKIIYLDQFVISNLVKLLDKSHPSHQKIKADPFWEKLFIKLENASKSQAIVCPDSFYHKDESLIGNTSFKFMRRLYEHFSSGKTLYPSIYIEKHQISHHFEEWLSGKKADFQFNPQDIAFEKDLHSWSVGMRISVNIRPYPGEVENLHSVNTSTKEQLKETWKRWQSETHVGFTERAKEEALGLWKGMVKAWLEFEKRRAILMDKMTKGEEYELDLNDVLPPMSNDILESMTRIARKKGIPDPKILEVVFSYFNNSDLLLEIPYIRISTAIYAGLAHKAASGKKDPPKSLVDVQFIGSYLPYCDAMFVDKESQTLLKEFPKNTPSHLRLKEFPAKIFSLRNKDEFLDYLDKLLADVPKEQIEILKDMNGEDYAEPYWGIMENEKIED